MIKNLKYRLQELICSRRVRMGSIALLLAITLSAVTLLGCPIHTVEIFTGQKILTLNTMFPHTAKVKAVEEARYPVYVTKGEETFCLSFLKGTVADALAALGFNPDSEDYVEPSLDTVITDTLYIDYVDVEYVTGTYNEAIPFETETVYTDKKDKGYSVLTKNGVNGEQQVTYTEKIVNGVSESKTVTETLVLTPAQNAVKTVGTKVKETVSSVKTYADVKAISTLKPDISIELDKNGNPVKYKNKMTVRATAYSYTGNKCATGVNPQPGYIAVNPKVIPYGTKMYIKSPNGQIIYGYAVAADTGGFIRRYPTGIDLFMSTEAACTSFGVKNMEVYILE